MKVALQNSDDRTLNRLVLLVGSNPLPNYLAVGALRPRHAVKLLHSPETQAPAERLRAALAAQWPHVEVALVCVSSATKASAIRDACQSLDVDHVHYSGGTKTMAVHARASLVTTDKEASYLDERSAVVRFDDGYEVELTGCETRLSLGVLLQLHGVTDCGSSTAIDDGRTAGDLEEVARQVRGNPKLAQTLYQEFRNDDRKMIPLGQAKCNPLFPARHGLSLSVPSIPGSEWTKARYEHWVKFLAGGWLEHWVASRIRSHLGSAVDMSVGVHYKRPPNSGHFEIDVALLRGHRFYAVSCTTDTTKGLCKSKLFEIAIRARQMGGDLARSALVCPVNTSVADELRMEIASLWDASNAPRVFGLDDMREWAGDTGSPDARSLVEWLDS